MYTYLRKKSYPYRMQIKHAWNIFKLKRKMRKTIDEFRDRKNEPQPIENSYIIWTCWWQGEADMPPIAKACYESVKRHSGGRKVVLIDRDNYKDFVEIDRIFLERLEKNEMTITHFSNIIRCKLLSKYGGLWLDATFFITEDLPNFERNSEFFSLRYHERFIYNEYKWHAAFLFSSKGNLIYEFALELLREYWRNENKMIDYFMFQYMFAIGYDEIKDIRRMIDSLPYTEKTHWLQRNCNEIFNRSEFDELCKTTHWHKQSWKLPFDKEKDGKTTYYGYILKTANIKL